MLMSVFNIFLQTALTISLLAAAATAVAAEPADSIAADSIAARNLSEITVTAKNVYKVNDGYAFVPSKTVKKTSFDVKQMISRVPLSNVVVGFDGDITDINKNQAKYFIDGQPATDDEIKALLNKDVARIEYLNYPSAGNFQGASFVVNIVTRKLISGGYVIANAYQRFFQPEGQYSLLGKYVGSPKWSVIVVGNYGYEKHTGTHEIKTTKFDLEDHVTGDMVHIDRISQQTGSLMRSRHWSTAAYWRYMTSASSQLSISAGFSSSRTPDNNEDGIIDHDADSDGIAYQRTAHSRAQSPYISAWWYKVFGNQMTLFISGGLYTTFSKLWSDYITGDSPVISNFIKERGYSPTISANWSVPLKHNNSLNLDASYTTSRFKVDYAGTANTVEHRHEDNYSVSASYRQSLKFRENTLSYNLSADLPFRSIKMSDNSTTNALDCDLRGRISYNIREKHTLGLFALYRLKSRPIKTMNDVKVQDTDISGHEGNPNLKANQYLNIDADYTWMASRKFNLTVDLSYSNESRNIVTAYNAYNGVVYTSMANAGTRESYSAGLRGSLQLFDNRLLIRPQVHVRNSTQSGPFNFSFWHVGTEINIDYMHPSGFSAGIWYTSPWGKGSNQDTSMIYDRPHHVFEIKASYSVGNLSLWLRCNPFYSYSYIKYYVDLKGVDIRCDHYQKDGLSRLIMISAKYIIDFGRKYQHQEVGVDARKITSM